MEDIDYSIEKVDIHDGHKKSISRILRIILGMWLFFVSLIIFVWFWVGLLLLSIGINYQIALCYIGLSDKATAVQYLRQAINQNSERANELHNKINPIKKRLIGYTILCCDGTTTSNRGRCACSKHGGICNWNYPVYDEYRQY